MSHMDYGHLEKDQTYNRRPSVSIDRTTSPSRISNALTGIVISKTEGLTRTTLRIRVGEHTDLRIRWQATLPAAGTANIGHMVHVHHS